MADEGYWVCFLTGPLSERIIPKVVDCAEQIGFGLVEETNDEITLRLDGETTLSITLNLGESWAWNDPRLILSFWTKPFQQSNANEESAVQSETVQNRTEKILELITELTKLTRPVYVWSMLNVGSRPDAGLRPRSRPITDNISRLSWVTVFSEQIVADLGGRDRLLETPAWRVDPIDDTHFMVVTTDNPVDPTFEPEHDPAEFLFANTGKESQDRS